MKIMRPEFLLILLFLGAGCASSTKKGEQSNEQSHGTQQGDSSGTQVESSEVELEKKTTPIKLILGPGLARGFAHIGVLRVFHQMKIPIAAIAGTEIGAAIGAAYASSKSVNEFDWMISHLKPNVLKSSKISLSRILGTEDDGSNLEGALLKMFKGGDLSQTKTPLRIGVVSAEIDEFVLLKRGLIRNSVRGSFAVKGIYKPIKVGGETYKAPIPQQPYPIEAMNDQFDGPVVVITVVDAAAGRLNPETREGKYAHDLIEAESKAQSVLQNADLVITPKLEGVSYFEFDKAATAILKGKQAAEESLDQLRALTGMEPSS